MECYCQGCKDIGDIVLKLTESNESIQEHLYELIYQVKRLITRRSLNMCPKVELPSVEGFNAMQTMEQEYREDGENRILERAQEEILCRPSSHINEAEKEK